MKKYKLTENYKDINGVRLYQIMALTSFKDVKAGDLGGYIEKEENLDQSGDACVSGNAEVYGDARVYGDACVSGNFDYSTIKGFGTQARTSTFFRCKDGLIRVQCGCFYGTIEEFKKQVENTRSGKVAKEYLALADLMTLHFLEDE